MTINIQPYIPTTGGYQVHPMYSSTQQNQLRLSSAIDARSSALSGNIAVDSSLISKCETRFTIFNFFLEQRDFSFLEKLSVIR